jgi:hypothetical protein
METKNGNNLTLRHNTAQANTRQQPQTVKAQNQICSVDKPRFTGLMGRPFLPGLISQMCEVMQREDDGGLGSDGVWENGLTNSHGGWLNHQ